MKRFVAIFLLLFICSLSFFSGSTFAAGQQQGGINPPAGGAPGTPADPTAPVYAVCDACNYCRVTKNDASDPYTVHSDYVIPDNWESCRKCLYPETTNAGNPDSKDTVLIDPNTGRAPTPKPGSYYTGVGCISTTLGNFREKGAAASVAKVLLNLVSGVAGGISLLYIIYGSFTILTSRAEPEKLNYGRRILIGAVVGLVFSISAVFIINFLANNVLKIPGFS